MTKIAPNIVNVGMHSYLPNVQINLIYQMDIQINERISILRNCSKVKLYCAVSLGLGLKGVKILAQNVAKFEVHDCLSDGHPNL